MTNDNSLLAYLAGRFTNQTEDLATEALGYILSQSVASREALRAVVRASGADVGPLVTVNTQDTGETGERPDLVGFDSQGKRRVLIEAKFWAGLTENQPNTYLERLPKDSTPAVLMFVAPEARLETLWAEILRRAATDFKMGPSTETEGTKTVAIGNSKRRLMLISWQTLLANMSAQVLAHGDSSAERDILQLQGLCEQEDLNAFMPLKSEQLGLEIARLMPHLVRLVQGATARGKREGFIGQGRLRFSSTGIEHGYRLRFAGAYAWFGIAYELWAYLRETPLWLVLWDKSGYMNLMTIRGRLQPLLSEELAIDNVTHIQIPIYLPTGVEYEAVLSTVVKILREVAVLISPPNGIPQGRPRKKSGK